MLSTMKISVPIVRLKHGLTCLSRVVVLLLLEDLITFFLSLHVLNNQSAIWVDGLCLKARKKSFITSSNTERHTEVQKYHNFLLQDIMANIMLLISSSVVVVFWTLLYYWQYIKEISYGTCCWPLPKLLLIFINKGFDKTHCNVIFTT